MKDMKAYPAVLETMLCGRRSFDFHAVDLFAGCGGLALGFEAAGISTIGFEMNADACETYRRNLAGGCIQTVLTVDSTFPECDVLIGGPPCQPFSVGGHQKGLKDSRDGFPVFVAAVRALRPPLWLFENVRGMLYGNRWYLDQIVAELKSLDYQVEFRLVNAVNYGVPQKRERIVVVGHKGGFHFPRPETTAWTAGQALVGLHDRIPKDAKFLTPSMDRYVLNYEKASKCIRPRDLYLDRPARTLTCRNLAGATGDMQRIRLTDGRRRRLTPREGARLQSFPDAFAFAGSELSVFKQIGNAVPPLLGLAFGKAVSTYLRAIGHQSVRTAEAVSA